MKSETREHRITNS